MVWELDHPDAYISQVYPYEDKVVIVWFWELGTKGTNRVLCVEVPSGKVLWENDASREYKKYGEDKLVQFYVHYWEDGNDDEDLYTELDVHTGEVYTRRYPAIMPMYLSRLSTRTTCSMAQRKLMPMSER